MEIFKILGTVAVDGMDDAARGLENLGNIATKVGKVMAAGIAAGAAAVGAIAKQSIEAYANYEQLVGGVQTLFGLGGQSLQDYATSVGKSTSEALDAWLEYTTGERIVLNNAENAYKTAGLSMNEYMETVTSFSASLLQSLGGDTVAAAEVADQAIIDMADNANKMGSSMQSIQNAYQGFAKQNYTMLDNLKLGYGGTKEEMKRLLEDAEKLSGIKYDMSNLADVYNAINVIQEEMGITGTTAKEAASTISGSLASTKAAWQNLLTSFGDDYADLTSMIDNLVESATTAVRNIVPRIAQILSGISEAMSQIMPVISAELPGILQELLPGLIDGAVALLNGLIASLPMILQILVEQLPSIVMQISQGLIQVFPVLLDTVKYLFGQIWNYIAVELLGTEADFESSFGKIKEVFNSLWEALQATWEAIGLPIWNAIQSVLTTLCDTFAQFMPEIGGFVSQCFTDIGLFWEENLLPCFEAIGNFIETVLAPVFEAVFAQRIKDTVQMAFTFVKNMWNNTLKPVLTGITDFLTGVFTLNFKQAWEGLLSFLKGILNGIITGIETMINGAISALNGLIAGINKAIGLAGALLGLSVQIPTIPLLDLPRLEEGGILEKGQVGLLEGKGAEAVVPLDQNKAWISAVARDMNTAIGGAGTMQVLEKILETLQMMDDGMSEKMQDAFASMKFDVNNREFARMVKAVG